ncbi:hypothetical protein ACIOC2_08315 [Streptomyces sp. NPDC088337]|uniref:hypothetical protein n=1 Tax=unclassified Streptomyces TaxID=2593676 RepID=UPI002DD8B9D7|nr:hypothetical protein [Streptomyces sp. NBC_01788]WSB24667.1 hypothetical protein OIE49_01405 [Streptomyces sp. NBC_01788]
MAAAITAATAVEVRAGTRPPRARSTWGQALRYALGLYWLFGTQVTPPGSWLLTAVLVILLAVGALTALPAWVHTRSPAVRALNAEPA